MLLLPMVAVGATVILAQRKHRNIYFWGISAYLNMIATLIALAFFGDLALLNEEEKKKSLQKERITLAVIVLSGVLLLVLRFVIR